MVILRLIFIVLAVSGTAARKDESMKVHRPLPGQWPQDLPAEWPEDLRKRVEAVFKLFQII